MPTLAPASWLRLLLAASVVLPGALFGMTAWEGRERTLRDANREITATVSLLREQASRILLTDELVLRQIDQLTQGLSWDEIRQSNTLQARLDAFRLLVPQIDSLSVIDPAGRVARISGVSPLPRVNVSDRDYFVALRDHPETGTFISRAYSGRVSGHMQFAVARRRTSADGSFDGIVVLATSPRYLTTFYETFAGPDRLAIALVRDDGAVLVRYPPSGTMDLPLSNPMMIALRTVGAGLIVSRSTIDGIFRLGGYARVEESPLVVSYGVSRSGVLAPWYSDLRHYGLLTGFMSLALMLVTWLALRGAVEVTASRQRLEAMNLDLADEVTERTRAAGALQDMNAVLEQRVAERTMDLTELAQQLEQERSRLETFIEASPFAKVVVDHSGIIIMLNVSAEHLFGYQRDELTGQAVEVLVPPRYRGGHKALRTQFFATASARPMGEGLDLFALRKDGSEVPVEVLLNPRDTPTGQVVVVGIADITARRQAQAALVQANQGLVAANQELVEANTTIKLKNEEVEAFVYIVSHDLRAPLINLQGFSRELEIGCAELVRVVEELELPEVARQRLKLLMDDDINSTLPYITVSVGKFDRLINALLELSRTGRYPMHPARLDVSAVVHASADTLWRQIEDAGATLVIRNLPDAVADPTALGQVFSNLIANAVKFADPARPSMIEIDGEISDGVAHYRVKDNGRGIPPRAKARLFQVFQRFHPEVKDGEGIGLATVRRLLERLGGMVWADSEPGVGTTFHFTLPIHTPPNVPSQLKETA